MWVDFKKLKFTKKIWQFFHRFIGYERENPEIGFYFIWLSDIFSGCNPYLYLLFSKMFRKFYVQSLGNAIIISSHKQIFGTNFHLDTSKETCSNVRSSEWKSIVNKNQQLNVIYKKSCSFIIFFLWFLKDMNDFILEKKCFFSCRFCFIIAGFERKYVQNQRFLPRYIDLMINYFSCRHHFVEFYTWNNFSTLSVFGTFSEIFKKRVKYGSIKTRLQKNVV